MDDENIALRLIDQAMGRGWVLELTGLGFVVTSDDEKRCSHVTAVVEKRFWRCLLDGRHGHMPVPEDRRNGVLLSLVGCSCVEGRSGRPTDYDMEMRRTVRRFVCGATQRQHTEARVIDSYHHGIGRRAVLGERLCESPSGRGFVVLRHVPGLSANCAPTYQSSSNRRSSSGSAPEGDLSSTFRLKGPQYGYSDPMQALRAPVASKL